MFNPLCKKACPQKNHFAKTESYKKVDIINVLPTFCGGPEDYRRCSLGLRVRTSVKAAVKRARQKMPLLVRGRLGQFLNENLISFLGSF